MNSSISVMGGRNGISDDSGNIISVQNPLPVDGDSIYTKDIWISESDIGDFSGSVVDLFNNLHSIIVNSESTNPKIIAIRFNRTVVTNAIGLGAVSGNFSNTKIELLNSGDTWVTILDDSGNDTKHTTQTYQLPVTAGVNGIRISFASADTVSLSNCVILKTIGVVSRLQAVKPDNTVTDINATAGGNLKMSLEEIESGISSNSNSQLNITPFGSTGIEHKQDLVTGSSVTVSYPHKEIHSGSHFYITGNTTLGVGGTIVVKLVTPDTGRWGHFLWELYSSGIIATTLKEDATGGMAGGARPTIHANNRNVNCWTGRHTGGDDEATALTDSTKTWVVDALIGYQVFNTADGSSGLIISNTINTVTVAALAGGTGNDWDTGDEYEINRSGFIITSGVTACTDHIQELDDSNFGSKSAGGALSREDEIIMKQNTAYCRAFTSGTASNIITFKAFWYEHENI